jgi:hypothetical protein
MLWNKEVEYDPQISPLGINPKELKAGTETDTHTTMS